MPSATFGKNQGIQIAVGIDPLIAAHAEEPAIIVKGVITEEESLAWMNIPTIVTEFSCWNIDPGRFPVIHQ